MMKKILIFIIIIIMIVPNLVGCKTRVKSYTLQDAYEKGLITKEELVSMAYYWNKGYSYGLYNSVKDSYYSLDENGNIDPNSYTGKIYTEEEWNMLNGRVFNEAIMGDDFTPIPKNPEELSEETIDIIKNYIAEERTKIMIDSIKKRNSKISDDEKKIEPYPKDDVRIFSYFGTYNNLICIQCSDALSNDLYTTDVSPGYSITIDGVEFFRITDGKFITCYKIK